jgi:peroxiredoxin Q/BCP
MNYLTLSLNGLSAEGKEQSYSLQQFKGEKVVLYFYPKDNTSGCTSEAHDFRDNLAQFSGKAQIIGVSPDSIKSHLKFNNEHNLNFILLADVEHKLAEMLGVWGEKSMYGKKYFGVIRSTFILDESGKIIKEWRKVKVDGHSNEVLQALL